MIEVFKIINGYAPAIIDNFYIQRKYTQFKKFSNYIK